MEKKNEHNGKRKESERLTLQANQEHTRRPLSNLKSYDYQVSRILFIYTFFFLNICI